VATPGQLEPLILEDHVYIVAFTLDLSVAAAASFAPHVHITKQGTPKLDH
jgi:hypothetical protein